MTTPEQKKMIIGVIRDCDLDWWIATAGGEEKLLIHVEELMTKFSQRLFEMCKIKSAPFSIFELYDKRRTQVRAFLQALVSSTSIDMLVMTWRIIQGMNVKTIHMKYEMEDSFTLNVVLASPFGDEEKYESRDIDDAALLRHIGIMKMDGSPVFHGFYPMYMGETAGPRTDSGELKTQLKSLRTALEVFMQSLFNRHLQIRKLERQNAMVPLTQIHGDHTIDLSLVQAQSIAPSEVKRPIDLAKNYAELWNKEVEKRQALCLYHEERMVSYVGTCIARALQQIDVIDGESSPREPSFGGRFFREINGMPWDVY
jgi:hypothetical protein